MDDLAAPTGEQRVAPHRAWLAGSVSRDKTSVAAFLIALRGLPWVLRERRVIPAVVEANLRLLEAPQRNSAARRYVG